MKTTDLVWHFRKEGLHYEGHEKSLKSFKQGSDNPFVTNRKLEFSLCSLSQIQKELKGI